jgi:hypothetical protein
MTRKFGLPALRVGWSADGSGAENTATALTHTRGYTRVQAADISAALRSLVKYLGAISTTGADLDSGGFVASIFSAGR